MILFNNDDHDFFITKVYLFIPSNKKIKLLHKFNNNDYLIKN